MMASWLSLDADRSGDEGNGGCYWQADLAIVARGNELSKTGCPECGEPLFDLRCLECGYADPRDVYALSGTIVDVGEGSFTLQADREAVESALPDGSWAEIPEPGLLGRARRHTDPEHCTVEFAHALPEEGIASFASIAARVEVLAVVETGELRALELNG